MGGEPSWNPCGCGFTRQSVLLVPHGSWWVHWGAKSSIRPIKRLRRSGATPPASGAFLLRLDPRLYGVLRNEAAAAGTHVVTRPATLSGSDVALSGRRSSSQP